MLFFRTISLVAALAFATLSSAVPVEGAGLVPSGNVFARDVTELSLPVKRGGGSSIPDLYDSCHQNIQGIIANIEIAIETGNHGVIVGYLNEIIAEINVLISGVRGYGSIELDIGLDVFGGIVYDLIQLIVGVLHILINISVEITSCINIIGGLLATLCQVTSQVVVGFNVGILGGLLEPLGGIFGALGFINIFVGIGIHL